MALVPACSFQEHPVFSENPELPWPSGVLTSDRSPGRVNRTIVRAFSSERFPRLFPSGTLRGSFDVLKEENLSYLPRARWGEVEAPVQRIFESFFEARGNVPNLFRVLALKQDLMSSFNQHFQDVLAEGRVSIRLKELVAVRVSALNGSDY
jgi:hypothetical protein